MAYSYTWPGTLPQAPSQQYGEDGGALMLRTPTDKGPAKLRRLGARPQVMSLAFYMTTTEVAAFETFVLTTLNSTARFGFPHPRTGSTVEARFVPGQDGKLYDIAYRAPLNWTVSFLLEILP